MYNINSKITIIIRTYNEEVWLGKVLKKISQQSYQPKEIIIVDSGSTDKTLEIVNRYNCKIIKILKSDFGYSYALNVGIKEVKTQYVLMLSGHSLPISNNFIKSGVDRIESNSKIASVTGSHYVLSDAPLYERIASWVVRKLPKNNLIEENHKYLSNTNSLIRKDLWDIYNFDEEIDMCEDYDWAVEMLSLGYNCVKDPKFTVFHSHYHVPNAKSWEQMQPLWQAEIARIDNKRAKRQ